MSLSETRVLSPIHLSLPREAQAWPTTTTLVHAPTIDVPPRWKNELPHQQFVTVLPFEEAAAFRDLSASASITRRDSDSNYDVMGVYRDANKQPVWLTGILHRDKKWATGYLDFGGRHRRDPSQPNMSFSILYGHPNTVAFDWKALLETLEEQFLHYANDPAKRRKLIHAWTPRLRPLADTMDRLEESAFAVVLSGENRHRGALADLGISRIPVITPAFKKFMNIVWPEIPYEVSPAGWFVKGPHLYDVEKTDERHAR